ncbi:MAG: hypothetical protein M1840_002381 [Geoglossum simile]|nr:MAG: hypothetical protein M1840_002381 [Geoglossum simile]
MCQLLNRNLQTLLELPHHPALSNPELLFWLLLPRPLYLLSGSPQQILNISSTTYSSTLVPSTAPNQGILVNIATAFLQGLYPPGTGGEEKITNGSVIANPLGGYQYVSVIPIEANDEDTIWLKGMGRCPACKAAASSYTKSPEFAALAEKTKGFYMQFEEALKGV